MQRKTIAIIAVVAVVAAYMLLTKTDDQRNTPAPTHSEAPDTPSTSQTLADSPDRPSLERTDDRKPILLSDEAAGKVGVDKVKRTLALYKRTLRYPRWSRPADGHERLDIEWNKGWPKAQPFAADDQRREIEMHAALDKAFADRGEQLTVTVDIFRPENGEKLRVTPDELVARVEYHTGTSMKVVAEVPMAKSGDHYTGSFAPSAIKELASKQRRVQLVVFARIGRFSKDMSLPFTYAVYKPFLVKRHAGDSIVDGSLVVEYDVVVGHVQPHRVVAVLFDSTGTKPLATYRNWFRPTDRGPQKMRLTFFGKILRESGVDGPYQVRALHGHVRVPGGDPLEVVWKYDKSTTTNAYSANQFSAEDYSSAEKDRMITRYQNLIDNGF